MNIIFEKILGDKILDSWTTIFDSEESLLDFMNEHKGHLLGGEFNGKHYSLKIRQI